MHSSQHIRAIPQKSSSCSDDATQGADSDFFRLEDEKDFIERKEWNLLQGNRSDVVNLGCCIKNNLSPISPISLDIGRLRCDNRSEGLTVRIRSRGVRYFDN